ncbi:hypothetical protein [Hyphococcus sp.]|uniref:hypothetical protein n=1 Tax=Hyphococcus sp. TaxID=2038636 RepID=UPI003CCC003F
MKMRDEAGSSKGLKIISTIAVCLASAACATAPQTPGPEPIAAPIAPAPPAFRLDEFLGAGPDAVDAMLGAPALTRKEGAGEYRRYSLSTCSLIIILYPDETGTQKVAHVDTTALQSASEKPDLEDCLAAG